jgi:hypothetical protein
MAMQCIPDGLIQVAQIEGVGVVRLIADQGMLADYHDIHNDERQYDQPGENSLTTWRAQVAPCLS